MTMLPDRLVFDQAVTKAELARLQGVCTNLVEQSTPFTPEEYGEELLPLIREFVGDLELIHCLGFAIRKGHSTEMHRDDGEYVAVFYPFTHHMASLRIERGNITRKIQVVENRLILLACTYVAHQQVVPQDDSVRYSIAFKFRLET